MSPVDNLCSGGFHLIIFEILSVQLLLYYAELGIYLEVDHDWRRDEARRARGR